MTITTGLFGIKAYRKLPILIYNNDRKSVPLSFFEEKGYLIKDGYNPIIDYIKIIDNYIGDKYGR